MSKHTNQATQTVIVQAPKTNDLPAVDTGVELLTVAVACFALFVFVIRPIMTRGVSAAGTMAILKSFGSTVLTFVQSKWTYILGLGLGLIVLAHMFLHPFVSIALAGALIGLCDIILNSAPATGTIFGVLEADAKAELQKAIAGAETAASSVEQKVSQEITKEVTAAVANAIPSAGAYAAATSALNKA